MKTCIGMALTVAMLLAGLTRGLAQSPVMPVLDDSTGSSYGVSPSTLQSPNPSPRSGSVILCFILTPESCTVKFVTFDVCCRSFCTCVASDAVTGPSKPRRRACAGASG